jgi:hypothetical protein
MSSAAKNVRFHNTKNDADSMALSSSLAPFSFVISVEKQEREREKLRN